MRTETSKRALRQADRAALADRGVVEYAWAAGLFEGEGCFTWTKKENERPYPTAHLGMTDEDVVRRFAEVVGIGKVGTPKRRANRKQQWQWRAFGAEAMRHLDATIGPYLGIRRRAKLDELLTFEPAREGGRGPWIGERRFSVEGMAALRASGKRLSDSGTRWPK